MPLATRDFWTEAAVWTWGVISIQKPVLGQPGPLHSEKISETSPGLLSVDCVDGFTDRLSNQRQQLQCQLSFQHLGYYFVLHYFDREFIWLYDILLSRGRRRTACYNHRSRHSTMTGLALAVKWLIGVFALDSCHTEMAFSDIFVSMWPL